MTVGVVDVSARIAVPAEAIEEFCRRHKFRELSLFGSVLRDDFRPDSDVDILVDFEPGTKHSFFDLDRACRELEGLLGHRVDLVTRGGLSPYIGPRILATREVVYVSEG